MRSRGFTLIEVLVTVATLIIVLGLLTSLARSVRGQASDRQTKEVLSALTGLLDKYTGRYSRPPLVPPLVPPRAAVPASEGNPNSTGPKIAGVETSPPSLSLADSLPDEAALRDAARANNREMVRALRREEGLGPSIFDSAGLDPGNPRLLDAWGRDIVLMTQGHPAIGTALRDRPFFFSAGPDGRYRTTADNLYSYEMATGERE